MAAFKIIIVALAAVCLAQAQFPSVQLPSFTYPTLLTQNAETSLKLAKTVINATNTIRGFINSTDNLMLSTVSTAQAQINAIVLNATTAAQNQSGINACTTKKLGELQALPLQASLNVVKCVTDKVQQFKNLLDSVLNLQADALLFIPTSLIQIQKCNNATGFMQPAMCFTAESFNIMNTAGRITGGVVTAVATGTSLVSTVQADVTLCATKVVASLAASALTIAGSYAICAVTSTIG